MTTLDRDRCRRLLAAARVGRLATVTADGRPHVVPCCFALVGDRLYSVVDGKPKSTTNLRRLDNIAARPSAALLVDHYDDDWSQLWWVRAHGRARVLDPDGPNLEPVAGTTTTAAATGPGREYDLAIDALADRYRPYRESRPDGPLVAVDVERLTGWAFDEAGPADPADPAGPTGR